MTVSSLTRRRIEWRHAWAVRFAHHPLCARHRHETSRLGAMHLCRGCASLIGGLALGTLLAVSVGGPWTATVAALLAPLVLGLSWPTWYPRVPRPLRDVARLALGFLIALGSHAIFSAPLRLWPLLLLGAALWWLYRRQRARVHARRCDGCPELGRGVCSGYAIHARAMRAIAADLEARMEATIGIGAPGVVHSCADLPPATSQ